MSLNQQQKDMVTPPTTCKTKPPSISPRFAPFGLVWPRLARFSTPWSLQSIPANLRAQLVWEPGKYSTPATTR